MSDEQNALSKTKDEAPAEGEEVKARGWLSWAVGWVLLPGSVIGVIFGSGALLGAHFHDSWFARAVVWIVDLF